MPCTRLSQRVRGAPLALLHRHGPRNLDRRTVVRPRQYSCRSPHRRARHAPALPAAAREGSLADQLRAGVSEGRSGRRRGTIWSRATSTRRAASSCSPRKTSRQPRSRRRRRIDILDFVEAEDIDDRFFDKPYYLTPGKGGDVAYGLLREAIRESGRIGIAKFIMREVQHLAAVEVVDEALVLSTLRFADELVDAGRSVSRSEHGREERARHGDVARREPGRRVEAREVHRRLPREPDAGHQSEDERQESRSRRGGAAARRQCHRSHGAAASEPRRIERTRAAAWRGQPRTREDGTGRDAAFDAGVQLASRARRSADARHNGTVSRHLPVYSGVRIVCRQKRH